MCMAERQKLAGPAQVGFDGSRGHGETIVGESGALAPARPPVCGLSLGYTTEN